MLLNSFKLTKILNFQHNMGLPLENVSVSSNSSPTASHDIVPYMNIGNVMSGLVVVLMVISIIISVRFKSRLRDTITQT